MAEKRILTAVMILLLLVFLPVTVHAAEQEKTFSFELTVDGKDTKKAEAGDIITVLLKLKRTDSQEAYTMYAMQDEIRYDSRFFELVEGSTMLGSGIVMADIEAEGNYRELYMNYLSTTGGNQWNAETMVGSFQLRVVGTSGVTYITNEDYLVSVQDGTDSYGCQSGDITVVLSEEFTVHFIAGEGIPTLEKTVIFGQNLVRPEDPVRDGYVLEGWYTDSQFANKWEFDRDTVQDNLILYAKWEQIPTVRPDGFRIAVWLLIPAAIAAGAVVVVRKKRKQQ